MFYFKLLTIIFIVVLLLITIFVNPILFIDNPILSYTDYLRYSFGYINTLKTSVLLSSSFIIEFILLFTLIKTIKTKFRKRKLRIFLLVSQVLLIFFILPVLILFYLPQHCSFNLCTYKEESYESIEDMKNKDYISFIGIGDIQLFLSDNFENRNSNILNLVNKLNLLISKIKNNDNSNIEFRNDDARSLFENSKYNLIGVINPGDLTQTSYDGRFFSHNSLGLYEFLFNLSPKDKGLSKFYNYEILGNHDYQSKHGDFTIDKLLYNFLPNNSKSLINRRNENRKYLVNKDENGNYSRDFGNLHIIFVNLHLSSKDLLTGKPDTNLNFLKGDLNKYHNQLNNKSNSKMRWGIVTHNYDGELELTHIYDIIKDYKKKLIVILSGHKHVVYPQIRQLNLLKTIILPSPAINEKLNTVRLLFFVYNNITSELNYLKIKIENNNNIIIDMHN